MFGACPGQEDDVIGILTSENIADLKPLGDRILLEVRMVDHAQVLHACEGVHHHSSCDPCMLCLLKCWHLLHRGGHFVL